MIIQRPLLHVQGDAGHPGANPTTSIYNASVVNFYNATDSLARFEKKKYFSTCLKTLKPFKTLAL
jgi:hypothetical protein